MRERFLKAIRKKSRHGFAGYPIATLAFYGPTDSVASKLAVGILLVEGEPPAEMRKWFSEGHDIRKDHGVFEEVLEFIRGHAVRSVAMTERVLGCPHEEGVDYPDGGSCPVCPFWQGRDRWAGVLGNEEDGA